MKKTLLFLLMLWSLSFISCSTPEEEKCWIFTIKVVTTTEYHGETQIGRATSIMTACDLTESQAKSKAEAMNTTITSTSGGVKIKTTTTVTYRDQNSEDTSNDNSGL